MDNFILLLAITSFILLIVGLIQPKALSKIFKGKILKRKSIIQIFGTATVVLFIIVGIIAEPSEQASNKVIQQNRPTASVQGVQTQADENINQPDEQEPLENKSEFQSEESEQNQTGNESNENYVFYPVTKVTDGDTIKVNIDGTIETIRMIGLDTPETVDPRKPVQCFGIEASNKAKELLSGKKVRLESDPTQGNRGKYGRLLRYVWLEDGTLYNKKMISDGYASEYTYNTPYKYQVEFKQAETEARNAKRGLWADDACLEENNQTSQTPPPVDQPSGHIFYTSSYHSAKYYYCDTDDGWKGLSEKYLKSFTSAEALLAKYSDRILHEPCE